MLDLKNGLRHIFCSCHFTENKVLCEMMLEDSNVVGNGKAL